MNAIALFAVVLAVAGGFIAWLGDWLGTKVGKKRMTFWKLRPRHTAMLYTIVSGGLISLLTLTVLIVSDSAFKTAMLEGPRMVLHLEQYRQQIQDQQAQVKSYESQLAEARRELAPVQTQLNQKQQLIDRKQRQLNGMQAALTATKQQLGDARQKVGAAQGQVRQAQRQVAAVQHQVQGLKTTRRQLQAQNQDLLSIAQILQSRVKSSNGILVFRQDEEVGRAVITTKQPVQAIRGELTEFLRDLGRDAAPRVGTTPDQAVALALLPNLRAEALDILSHNIAEQSGKIASVVIVARARRNSFHGEAVLVSLRPYDNTRIYPKGAVVASQTIDGTQSEAQILTALQTFFTERVRSSALRHGLIPRNDPLTHTRLVGAIDGPTTLALRNKIQQIGANAQVTAYARVNTYSSGPVPMLLDFDVKPASAAQTRPALTPPGGTHS